MTRDANDARWLELPLDADQIRLLGDMVRRKDELDQQVAPFSDARTARDELQRRLGRLSKAMLEPDYLEMRRQLVTLLAQGLRMARDVGILTEEDAVRLDDGLSQLGHG
jgi:ATP-dependent helicase YprA (DUF1998 family)